MKNSKKFILNGVMLTAVGIAMRSVALLFNSYISRAVGAEGVGLYTVVNTVYGFAVTFATAGISLTVTRLVAEAGGEGREGDIPRIISGAVLYTLVFAVLGALALFLGADLIAERILAEPRAAVSLRILAPSLIPISLVSVFSGYFVGVRRVGYNAAVQIICQLFRIFATVWLLVHAANRGAEESARYLSVGVTVAEVLSFLLMLVIFLMERIRGGAFFASENVRAVGKIAIPLALSAYIRQALITVEHILIPRRLRLFGESSSEALASYGTLHGMALPLILYPMVTLSSFSGLLVPEFAEQSAAGNRAGMERLASSALSKTLTYAMGTAAILFVFSEELGFVVYGSHEAGRYIAVLSAVVPIMYLDHVTDSILKGIGEQVYSMWVNITDSLLSIVLIWFLLPKMGIIGYAVAIIVMEAYNFVLSMLRLSQRIRIRISLFSSVLCPFVSALASSLLVRMLFVRQGSGASVGWLVAEMVFSVSAFIFSDRIMFIVSQKKRKGSSA